MTTATATVFTIGTGKAPIPELLALVEANFREGGKLVLLDELEYEAGRCSNGGQYSFTQEWYASDDGWWCEHSTSHSFGLCRWCGSLDQEGDHEENWGCGPMFLTNEELAEHLSHSVDWDRECYHYPGSPAYTLWAGENCQTQVWPKIKD